MTVDEAINNFTEAAKNHRKEQQYWLNERDETSPLYEADCLSLADDSCESAEYYEQLAEWLTELKEAKSIIRVCNRVLGYLLECEIESTSTRNEVETLLKSITEYLSGGSENAE